MGYYNVKAGELLDCRNDANATVGQRVLVVSFLNTNTRAEDFVTRVPEQESYYRKRSECGVDGVVIGVECFGRVTETSGFRATVEVE